jgi:hypothetical protein
MKKTFIVIFIIIVASLMSRSSMAEVRPYIGVGYNRFVITYTDISKNETALYYESETEVGMTEGLNGGVVLDDNARVNFAYFSGKASIFKATVIAVSYDYCYNNSGVQKGWFLGGGISSVKTEIEPNSLTTASSQSSSWFVLRGGYEYLMDNNLFFEVGYNMHLAKQEYNYDYINESDEGSSTFSVNNLNLSLSYMFQ